MKTPYELIEDKYNELIQFFKENKVRNSLDVIKEIIINYIIDNRELFFKLQSNSKEGVYFIEDFYIGKTQNINIRIAYHIMDGFNPLRKNDVNIEKAYKIEEILKKRTLKFKMLSNIQSEEEKYIIKYSKKYKLTNKEFNPNYTYKPNSVRKKEIEIINSSYYDDIIPDKGNLNDFLDIYNTIDFKNKRTKYEDGRFIVLIRNKKSKRVGVYITKSKLSFISSYSNINSQNKKIIEDYNKYGSKSYEIEFIKTDSNYEKKQIEFILDYKSNGIELYNHSIPKYN
jgi:hypothetical protein